MVAPRKPPLLALVDELLADQQTLQTPVARFSRLHEQDEIEAPALAAVYRDLIPLTQPGPGEQYAFEVDLDACTGCKACVAGCHSLNGLDDTETWRDVGNVIGGCGTHPFQQTITSACHHCADPGCLNGCPVEAYEKDPVTGIVRHLDDQCIGCSYCILKCPYDVPKYNDRLGIVRKCDMCHGRLAEGEAPACVQACPTQAIRIVKVTVDLSGKRPRVDTSDFLPGAPDPAYTQPTTRYVSKRQLPTDLRAADQTAPRLQPAHWPLVLLLTLTQAGYGLSLAAPFAPAWIGYAALALSSVGMVAAGAHLGRPLRAWRIFLGLRRSWLSREAVLLGAWFPLHIVAILQPQFVPFSAVAVPAAAVLGAAALFCSAMIYIDTPRKFWRPPATTMRMGGTILTGALLPVAPVACAVVLAGKLLFEWRQQYTALSSAQLLRTRLSFTLRRRVTLGVFAIVGLITHAANGETGPLVAAAVFWLLSEITERYIYFRAVDSAKMPGITAA